MAEKTIEQIIAELSKKIDAKFIHQLPARGKAKYIPHYDVKAILNLVVPAWEGHIVDQGVHTTTVTDKNTGEVSEINKVWIKYRLSIPHAKGVTERESYGHEDGGDPDNLYGDPWSNAEAMAFKRCAAWFGLGLKDLYGAIASRPTFEDSENPPDDIDPIVDEGTENNFISYAKEQKLDKKVIDRCLSLADGDDARAFQIAQLFVMQRDGGLKETLKVILSWDDLSFDDEQKIMKTMGGWLKGGKGRKEQNMLTYLALALENNWSIDHASLHLARSENDIDKAISVLGEAVEDDIF